MKRHLGAILLVPLLLLAACDESPKLTCVDVGQTHHMGENYSIGPIYLGDAAIGNIGRGGDTGSPRGGCVAIPTRWHPGLIVDVRWGVYDWTAKQLGVGYQALVPIEQYDKPADVIVHFFPGNKVRIIVSDTGEWNPRYPIQRDDPHAGDSATPGHRTPMEFSPEEYRMMKKKDEEFRKKYGDWR